MIRITLSDEEKLVLKNYFKTTPLILIRLKSQAILLRDKSVKVEDVADVLDKDIRTIERWVKDFTDRRLASIFTGQKDNQNAAKLTREQKEEVKQTLKNPPSDKGLPKEFWDIPALKKYVKAEFGTVYESDRSYHYLLRFSNLSFKQPDVFDVRRNEEKVRKRLKEIRKEIIPLMNDPEWEVLAADETRIMLEAITRRAWLRRGEKTILKVERSNESQYYIGFLNLKTGKDHLYALKWGNQKEIVRAVEDLATKLYLNRHICIIWDNVSFHKGKILQEKLKKNQSLEKVHLINLPPYAPDTNPQETIWNSAKKYISNRQFKKFSATKRSFRHYISTNIFNYTI